MEALRPGPWSAPPLPVPASHSGAVGASWVSLLEASRDRTCRLLVGIESVLAPRLLSGVRRGGCGSRRSRLTPGPPAPPFLGPTIWRCDSIEASCNRRPGAATWQVSARIGRGNCPPHPLIFCPLPPPTMRAAPGSLAAGAPSPSTRLVTASPQGPDPAIARPTATGDSV